jgi:all-trans-retinol 13,14-reductase
MHASVVNHYLNGGFYPRGGACMIAKNIVPVIERTGGRVLVRAGVEDIIMHNGRTAGVRTEKGVEIFAPIVISACGVFNTYNKLLPPEVVPPRILDRMEQLGPSCSMIYLFVGMHGTPEELQLRSSNIWHLPDGDFDKMLHTFYEDPENAPMPAFIGFPCAKDSTWGEQYPGISNAVILTMGKYEWWEAWEGTDQGKRGEAYEAKKKMFEQRILEDALFKYYPQCRGRITYTSVGTSLTFNHYIGSQRGEVYGMESHPSRFDNDDWLRPETSIPGLYLTGQDVTTLGITGALMAGVLTAHAVLGYGNVVDMLSGRNLVEDIWHLEAKQGKRKSTATMKKLD